MNTSAMFAFDLHVMAVVLHQTRRLDRLSCGLLALALLMATAAALGGRGLGTAAVWLLAASVCAGLAQAYCAARLALDVDLLRAAARLGDAVRAADALDASLQRLGLLGPGHGGRDWSARWYGMRRWCRRQATLLGVQALAFTLAWLTAGGR